jgi:hypothetical protein
VSNSFPVQHQAEGPPQLSQALQLPQEIAQTQLWTQTLSKSVARVHSEATLPCSFTNQQPLSPSHIRSCTINCPTSQHMTQLCLPKKTRIWNGTGKGN